ncbi:MAG: helix-turn-helix domain-containing protein [Lentimicrobiaceae bacterium]|nr:helix-turn-helix domain-containing protein [Lentimicrobiaceae bacterium]
MNINDLITQPNITISLTGEQLNDFANQILNGARAIYEQKEQPEQHIFRKQAAEKLNVDLSTLWRWARENYLIPVKVGKKVLYKLSDIERIMKGGSNV